MKRRFIASTTLIFAMLERKIAYSILWKLHYFQGKLTCGIESSDTSEENDMKSIYNENDQKELNHAHEWLLDNPILKRNQFWAIGTGDIQPLKLSFLVRIIVLAQRNITCLRYKS